MQYDERLQSLLDLLPEYVRDQFAPQLIEQFAALPAEEQAVYLDLVPKLHSAVQDNDPGAFANILISMGYGDYAPLLWGMVKNAATA